jgi:hypothetical protein
MTSTLSQGVNIAQDKAEPERVKAAEAGGEEPDRHRTYGVDASGRHVDVKERARHRRLKALEDAQLIVQDQHANRSLAAILALVRSQQQLAERKAIIYFTLNETAGFGLKGDAEDNLRRGHQSRRYHLYRRSGCNEHCGAAFHGKRLRMDKPAYNPTDCTNAYGQTAVQSQQEHRLRARLQLQGHNGAQLRRCPG